jgi:DNA-binding XRE family transcriptional regulator
MDAKAIGQRLVSLRGTRTQEEVARAIGASLSAIGMYERGERIPRDEMKLAIAKYYDTTVQAIFYADK